MGAKSKWMAVSVIKIISINLPGLTLTLTHVYFIFYQDNFTCTIIQEIVCTLQYMYIYL